ASLCGWRASPCGTPRWVIPSAGARAFGLDPVRNDQLRLKGSDMKQTPPSEKRQRPLPDHRPNPSADDPAAPARIEAVIASPSYCRSDRDPDFLQRAD